ncbi:MAG TPA: DNA polymerase III subunit delta [Gemmatimonadaceae bacterium]|nr:DNA polymerase III subunit delta [Gemmatimonadaceae bacterium]
MSTVPPSQRALFKAIKERSFAPAYYFHGDDDYLKDDALKQLLAAAVDPATRDFNLDVRRGSDLDGEALGVLLNTLPMMAERRVVVVRDVPALRKDVRTTLERYLERPAPETLLVLIAPAGAKADKVLAERAAAVEFAPLTGDRVPRWIAHHVSTELGASITPEAAELLHAAVGADLPALASELDKLASYAGGGEIDERAVTEIVGVRRGETLGDLLDRVAERDAAGALALVAHVLAQPKTSAVSAVIGLTTQALALGWGYAMRAQGTPQGRLEGEYFGLLKETGGLPMRPWGEAVKAWARSAQLWPPAATDRALALLLAADCALKETRLSSDEQLLGSLVLALCADPAQSAAA